jgi:hypothetical protein
MIQMILNAEGMCGCARRGAIYAARCAEYVPKINIAAAGGVGLHRLLGVVAIGARMSVLAQCFADRGPPQAVLAPGAD